MSFAAGSLVEARGREWIVLPESEGDLLVLMQNLRCITRQIELLRIVGSPV